MATGAVSLRYFILGLLARQPMSGYDIKRSIRGLSWLIGSPSSGGLYPALRALVADELATVELVLCEDKPPRKVYSITGAGKRALQEWTDLPSAPDEPLKAFVMRLLLASNFARPGLVRLLQRRRTRLVAQREALERMAEDLDANADLGQRLALQYSLSIATAELDCLDKVSRQLAHEPLPEEVRERERVASAD